MDAHISTGLHLCRNGKRSGIGRDSGVQPLHASCLDTREFVGDQVTRVVAGVALGVDAECVGQDGGAGGVGGCTTPCRWTKPRGIPANNLTTYGQRRGGGGVPSFAP